MSKGELTPLPIDDAMTRIIDAVVRDGALVISAEPGAGKTTRVPPALAFSNVTKGDVLVLEPRRIAARSAAARVATERGERVGESVGYVVRFDRTGGRNTKLWFLTEGVLTRRLATDPTLDGVGAVIIDEVHERSLHADLALAWLRHLRATLRPDLKVLAMSATVDADAIARGLGCTTIRVGGRTYPVTIEHLAAPDTRPLRDQVLAGIRRGIKAAGPDGDVLVFLPGAGEIRRVADACADARLDREVLPLHGELPPAEQDRAIAPGSKPRIVLATNVAETSVTLPSVVAVVDAGLARVPRVSPWTGLSTLETKPISRASATQRAGRAGRVREGFCFRLYTKADHDARAAYERPEIQRSDLAELVLSIAVGGLDVRSVPWIEAPTPAALDAAIALLARLGALDRDGHVTSVGRELHTIPAHPRVAKLLLEARSLGVGARGAIVAAVLGERDLLENDLAAKDSRATTSSDLLDRIEAIEEYEASGGRGGYFRVRREVAQRVVRARDALARALRVDTAPSKSLDDEASDIARAVMRAFPDRIARRKPGDSAWVIVGGGSVALGSSAVRDHDVVVVVDADGASTRATGRLLVGIEPEWVLEDFPDRIRDVREAKYDASRDRVFARIATEYDGLTLDEALRPAEPGIDAARALDAAIRERGFATLVDADRWSMLTRRWAFARTIDASLPELGESDVLRALEPTLEHVKSLAELRDADPISLVLSGIGSDVARTLNRIAPEAIDLGGRRTKVHYEAGQPPWIESRIQDFFGLTEGPVVGDGRIPLVLHLLAPNARAVQVTSDLAGFWERHYPATRKELSRRYPRHAWPENPRVKPPPRPPRSRG